MLVILNLFFIQFSNQPKQAGIKVKLLIMGPVWHPNSKKVALSNGVVAVVVRK